MTFKCFLMHLLTKFLFFSGQSKKEVFLTYFVLFKYVLRVKFLSNLSTNN